MAEQEPKRLLMLCYHFSPSVSGGVERSARFARYLPEHGWTPLVVTTNRWGAPGGEDDGVLRVGELFRGGRSRVGGRGGAGAGAGSSRDVVDRNGRRAPLFRFAEKWLLVPDKHVRWTAMALLPALGKLGRGRADAIYTTSPPASAHVLGLILKKLTGKPWIMDLRDPWTLEPLNWYLRAGGARLALERRIERICFGNADAIIVTTEEAALKYRELYPGRAGRIHWIPNGFDAREFEVARSPASAGAYLQDLEEGCLVISHLGTFCRYTDAPAFPKGFLDAVKKLAGQGVITNRTCRIIFAGAMNRETERLVGRYDLGGLISMTGPVPHIGALSIMLRSDVLLLYDPNTEGNYYIHGKLYEYLAAGRWILGVLPAGATRSLLERSERAIAIARDDGEEISRVLVRALRERGHPPGRRDFDLSRYEGRNQARDLARIIEGACR
jgi:glycosyltransferase involved in cell wall biosynthesis